MKKNIFRGVSKVFDSNFSKLLLAATAVYLGGAAMGAWEGPFASPADAPGGAGKPPGAGGTDTPSGGGVASSAANGVATDIGAGAPAAKPAATPTSSGGGFISGAMSNMSTPMKYGLINAAAGAAQAAFSPSPEDQANAVANAQRSNMEWKQRFLSPNFDVGSINVGTPSGHPVRDNQGNQLYPTRDASGNVIYTTTPPAEQQPSITKPAGGIIKQATA